MGNSLQVTRVLIVFGFKVISISQPREYSKTELEARELKQPEFKQLNLFDIA